MDRVDKSTEPRPAQTKPREQSPDEKGVEGVQRDGDEMVAERRLAEEMPLDPEQRFLQRVVFDPASGREPEFPEAVEITHERLVGDVPVVVPEPAAGDGRRVDPEDSELFNEAQQKGERAQRTQSEAVKLEQVDDDSFVEVIDLTLSEDEDSENKVEADDGEDSTSTAILSADEDLLGGRTALITPIATTLKADRLGIGLKAKTEGPYHVSKKRITHNKAALAAHIQAAERLRRQKQEIGRGYRSFARASKKESTARQQMLAYMNS